jgi:Holliday junction resolvasome RuvABC endonuclease subunit
MKREKQNTNDPFTLSAWIESNEGLHILTCDPSLTAFGFAIVEASGTVLETGCVKTEPLHKKLRTRVGDDRCRRISEINSQLLTAIRKHNVHYIVSELPHGSQSSTAAIMIGITVGMLQTMADTLNIGIEWYSEGDAKKALLNKNSAGKQETVDAIKQLYSVEWDNVKYKDEAVADALAVFNVARKQSPFLKLNSR